MPDYEKTLFLDIDPECEPDFIGDINCLDFARRFPRESFDEIYTSHMPMELPEDNFATWKVFLHLLKPGGKVYLDGIIWQFSHRGPTVGTHRWYPLKRAISVHLTGQCDHHCLFHSVECRNVSFFKRIKVYHPNRNKSKTSSYRYLCIGIQR